MYLCDYHIHSTVSFDGKDTITALAKSAAEAGLSEICVTDHCDIDTISFGKLAYDYALYAGELEKARRELGKRIKLRAGVELGQPLFDAALTEKVLSNPYDFVIGSVHADREGDDYYFKSYESAEQCLAILEDYLEHVRETCARVSFSVLGHLTYPLRYMRGRGGISVDFSPFFAELRGIFRLLVDRGIGIEVNCSGLFSDLGETLPPPALLRLYRECGGEIITVGSDAHTASGVGRGVREGMKLLSEAGFRYFTVFEAMTPRMVSIG